MGVLGLWVSSDPNFCALADIEGSKAVYKLRQGLFKDPPRRFTRIEVPCSVSRFPNSCLFISRPKPNPELQALLLSREGLAYTCDLHR